MVGGPQAIIGYLGAEIILKGYKNSEGFLSYARLRLLCAKLKKNMKSFSTPSVSLGKMGHAHLPITQFSHCSCVLTEPVHEKDF